MLGSNTYCVGKSHTMQSHTHEVAGPPSTKAIKEARGAPAFVRFPKKEKTNPKWNRKQRAVKIEL